MEEQDPSDLFSAYSSYHMTQDAEVTWGEEEVCGLGEVVLSKWHFFTPPLAPPFHFSPLELQLLARKDLR